MALTRIILEVFYAIHILSCSYRSIILNIFEADMILYNLLSIYTEFFNSDLFLDVLIYPVSFGLIISIIILIWKILRGYI